MAERLLRALPVSVANHVKARRSLIERSVTWLATESGRARSKRSAICSGKLWGGFIIFGQCCPCDVNGLAMMVNVGMTAADLAQRRGHEECHKAIVEFSASSPAQHSSPEHAATAAEKPGNFCVYYLNVPSLPRAVVMQVWTLVLIWGREI